MCVVLPAKFTPAQMSNGKCNSTRSVWFSLREGSALERKSPVVTPYTAEAPRKIAQPVKHSCTFCSHSPSQGAAARSLLHKCLHWVWLSGDTGSPVKFVAPPLAWSLLWLSRVPYSWNPPSPRSTQFHITCFKQVRIDSCEAQAPSTTGTTIFFAGEITACAGGWSHIQNLLMNWS